MKRKWPKNLSMYALTCLFFLSSGFVSCQQVQKANQNPQPKSQATSAEQTQRIKKILSAYSASKLTAADAKAIMEKFREAGIHVGPENNSAIIAAGFDPEKLRTLAPPPDQTGKPQDGPPSIDESLKIVEEKICKPLSLTTVQKVSVSNAFKEFYAEMGKIVKNPAASSGPPDRAKVEPLEKTRDAKIKTALSAEQYIKYLELEKAARPARPGEKTKK